MCGETRIPRDMCAGNTLPGETYIAVTAALLPRPKPIEIPISPFVISFRKFNKSNMLVCLSTSLLDVSITFVCVGTFLQSLENVRARQLGATINTTYCLFCFIDSTKIAEILHNPTGVSLVLNTHFRNSS